MPTQKTLREILNRLSLYYYNLGFEQMHCDISHPKIIQIISEIKTLLKEKLPTESKIPEVKQNFQSLFPEEIAILLHQRSKIIGYNQALTEIEKILEAL